MGGVNEKPTCLKGTAAQGVSCGRPLRCPAPLTCCGFELRCATLDAEHADNGLHPQTTMACIPRPCVRFMLGPAARPPRAAGLTHEYRLPNRHRQHRCWGAS
jgi:hypothetical protein